MNKNVLMLAINDLKNILNQIESNTKILEEDYIRLDKEINSFLCNLSSYKLRNTVKKDKLFSALQYAFNMIKHEKRVFKVETVKTGGIAFPIRFPMEIPCNKVYWIDVKKLKPNSNWETQYKNYLFKLNEKQIIDTLKELELIL